MRMEKEGEKRMKERERERERGGGGGRETTPYLRVLPDIERPPVQLHNRSFLHMHENLVQRLISVALQVTPHHKCTIIGQILEQLQVHRYNIYANRTQDLISARKFAV